MIVGLGVDITEVSRIEDVIQRRGRSFLERVFTPSEISYCERHRHRAERYAGRFAAKEAVSKALGTGFSGEVTVHGIEILRLPTGAPTVNVIDGVREVADALGIAQWFISISYVRPDSAS